MKRKLTMEELAQVKKAYDEEGDVGALLVLMKQMGMEDYHGEYEVQWHVNYDEHGDAMAELNVLGKILQANPLRGSSGGNSSRRGRRRRRAPSSCGIVRAESAGVQ